MDDAARCKCGGCGGRTPRQKPARCFRCQLSLPSLFCPGIEWCCGGCFVLLQANSRIEEQIPWVSDLVAADFSALCRNNRFCPICLAGFCGQRCPTKHELPGGQEADVIEIHLLGDGDSLRALVDVNDFDGLCDCPEIQVEPDLAPAPRLVPLHRGIDCQAKQYCSTVRVGDQKSYCSMECNVHWQADKCRPSDRFVKALLTEDFITEHRRDAFCTDCRVTFCTAARTEHARHRFVGIVPATARCWTWTDLPHDLVARILKYLPCRVDHAVFASVCKDWSTVAKLNPPLQFPLLLLPHSGAEEACFSSVVCEETHRAILPVEVLQARCCGSFSGGWILLSLQRHQPYAYQLFNLVSGDNLTVPSSLITPDGDIQRGMIISCAALSTTSIKDDGAFLAAVVDQCTSTLAFWRSGELHMTPPTPVQENKGTAWRNLLPESMIADIIYYAGNGIKGFYVLTATEEILVYIPELGADGVLTTQLVTYRFPNHKSIHASMPTYQISRYLLEASGVLCIVLRIITWNEETKWFHLFQLKTEELAGNERKASWVPFSIADEAAAFIGRCCSRYFNPSPAPSLNGLYFIDDATSIRDVARALQAGHAFPCRDMGRHTLVTGVGVQRVFRARPASHFSPAAWYFY